MKKLLIIFMMVLLLILPSCDPNGIPNVPEPSDADKAVLNDIEKALLQKVVVANFGDSYISFAKEYEGTSVMEGAINTQGDHKFTDGTVKMTKKNESEYFISKGKLDDVDFSFEHNFDFTSDTPSREDVNNYKDTSYVKFNATTWKKGDENFTKFVTNNVNNTDGELYTAYVAMISSSAMESWTKATVKTTFKLENATVDYSALGISEVRITSSKVIADVDMGIPSKDDDLSAIHNEETAHVQLGKTTINYKDSNGETKTLNIDSSNIVFKTKDDGQNVSGVKKGADIKVSGKQVKLSDIFDASILY